MLIPTIKVSIYIYDSGIDVSTQKYQFPVSHLDKTETKNYRIFDKTETNGIEITLS